MFGVFAVLFYVGAILVDDGTVDYQDFFTAMFAVIFGAFGVGLVSLWVFGMVPNKLSVPRTYRLHYFRR